MDVLIAPISFLRYFLVVKWEISVDKCLQQSKEDSALVTHQILLLEVFCKLLLRIFECPILKKNEANTSCFPRLQLREYKWVDIHCLRTIETIGILLRRIYFLKYPISLPVLCLCFIAFYIFEALLTVSKRQWSRQ